MELTNISSLEEVYNAELDTFCTLPDKPITLLVEYFKNSETEKTAEQVRKELIADYAAALVEDRVRLVSDKIIFSSRYIKPDGTAIEITLKKSNGIDKPMFLYYVDLSSRSAVDLDPGKSLERFAFLGSWASFLSELAEYTLPEVWSSCDQNKDNDILWQYIKYTFYRLSCEHKIAYAVDGSLAAFNTGLLSQHYEDIYACFIPNTTEGSTPWRFIGFCTEGSGSLGKQLTGKFKSLPEPAKYISKVTQLTMTTGKSISLDYEHIIKDNISRFPKDYLKKLFPDNYSLEDYDNLVSYLKENPDLYIRIQNDLNAAAKLSMKLATRDYHYVLPCYFPKGDKISALIPLALAEPGKPDLALVIEATASGNYQGQTILTMDQAYIDARLINRVTNNWLCR